MSKSRSLSYYFFIKIKKEGVDTAEFATTNCEQIPRWSIWIWVSPKDCGGPCMIIKVRPSIPPKWMIRIHHTSGSFFLRILWPKICARCLHFPQPAKMFAGHVESWQRLYLKNITNSRSLALRIPNVRTKWTMLSSTGSWHMMRNKRVLKVKRFGLNSIKTQPFMNSKALRNCVFAAELNVFSGDSIRDLFGMFFFCDHFKGEVTSNYRDKRVTLNHLFYVCCLCFCSCSCCCCWWFLGAWEVHYKNLYHNTPMEGGHGHHLQK